MDQSAPLFLSWIDARDVLLSEVDFFAETDAGYLEVEPEDVVKAEELLLQGEAAPEWWTQAKAYDAFAAGALYGIASCRIELDGEAVE